MTSEEQNSKGVEMITLDEQIEYIRARADWAVQYHADHEHLDAILATLEASSERTKWQDIIIARFISLSAHPNEQAWAAVAIEAMRLLNIKEAERKKPSTDGSSIEGSGTTGLDHRSGTRL